LIFTGHNTAVAARITSAFSSANRARRAERRKGINSARHGPRGDQRITMSESNRTGRLAVKPPACAWRGRGRREIERGRHPRRTRRVKRERERARQQKVHPSTSPRYRGLGSVKRASIKIQTSRLRQRWLSSGLRAKNKPRLIRESSPDEREDELRDRQPSAN